MFSRLKALGERDFSGALNDSFFKLDDVARFGLGGALTTMAFDPVQSLLAVGTDSGKIHVLGQQNVEVVFPSNGRYAIVHLRIVKSLYLVSVDQRNRVTVIDLDTKETLSEYNSTYNISAVETDPALDWLFLGLDNGQIMVYDIDRGGVTPYRIGNLQKSVLSKFRMSPVLSIELHPRDASQILVCYTDIAVVFSIAQSEILLSLRYEVPAGAPGGDTDPMVIGQYRHPQYVSACWHPNGHHILTAHVDGSLVFWDGTEGKLLHARTLIDTDVNVPRRTQNPAAEGSTRNPITKVAWICTNKPEETSILVSGGDVFQGAAKGLTMLDFGPTPEYTVTSYAKMSEHYSMPRRHKIFPIPDDADVAKFWTVARESPFYGGNFNPKYVMLLLTTGELITISYPDGNVITDPTLLPPSLGWISPHVSVLSVSLVPRTQWIGMLATVRNAEGIFRGGAPARRHLRQFQDRAALCTGHRDGTVKLWDASHGEIEDSNVLEVSMSNALRKHKNIAVEKLSFAGKVGELAVAAASGEIVLFAFGVNKRDLSRNMGNMKISDEPELLEDISFRAPSNVKEGFLPQTLVSAGAGRCTALVNSSIGFVGIGYENGEVIIIDKRGPAVIFRQSLAQVIANVSRKSKRSSISSAKDYPTAIEVGIYALDDETYSSIVVSVGSSAGNVYTLRIVPSQRGGYEVVVVGAMSISEEPVISLSPLNLENGTSAVAEPEVMSQLAHGILIPSGLAVVTRTHVRVIRQPNDKITHKKFANYGILSAGISYLRENDSLALVLLTDQSELKILGLPNLREISVRKLPYNINPQYGKNSVVTRTGDVVARADLHSGGLLRIWGRGIQQEQIPEDALYDVMKTMPPRPTISTLQWVKGKQFTKLEDLDLLIGGSRRPKSKRQVSEERARAEQERLIREKQRRTNTNSSSSNWGYEDAEERGEKIGGVQGALDNLEQVSSNYMSSLNDFVKDAKTNALKSSFKAKFFG